MFKCTICGKEFKNFREGGYMDGDTIKCPECDERLGHPIVIIDENSNEQIVYKKGVGDALNLIAEMFGVERRKK